MEKFKITSTGIDPYIKTNADATQARFGHINAIVNTINNIGGANIEAGSFLPVASDEIDCSIPLIYNAFYSRVNDIVTMTITFEYQLINGQTTGSFNISLPVSSNFTNLKDVSGIIQAMNGANISAITAAGIQADITNDLITINITCPNADDSVQYVCANIQYLVQ